MSYRYTNWKARVVLSAIVLMMSLLIGAASALQSEDNRGNHRGRSGSQMPQLRTAVFTDRREYLPGQTVAIETRLINVGRTATFLNTQEYDILIREARSGMVVWQWSWQFTRRGLLPPRTPSFTLTRWEARVNHIFWNQTSGNGRPVPPGVYLIEAQIYPHTVTTPIRIVETRNNRRP